MTSPAKPPVVAVRIGHFIDAYTTYDSQGGAYTELQYGYGPAHHLPRPASGSHIHQLTCCHCNALVQLSVDSLEVLEAHEQRVQGHMRRVIEASVIAAIIALIWGVTGGAAVVVLGLVATAVTTGFLALLRLLQPGCGWRVVPDDHITSGYWQHTVNAARHP